MNLKTKQLTMCALFATLNAILSQIAIPIGPVPINLVHLSIFVSASLLGAKYSTLSQCVYILLGSMGAPVFSNFSGGLGILFGPTGGFIVGYIGCAFITGLLMERLGSSLKLSLAMGMGLMVSYALGTSWFMFSTQVDLMTAITICIFPFLLGDSLKIIFSTILITRLKPHFPT